MSEHVRDNRTKREGMTVFFSELTGFLKERNKLPSDFYQSFKPLIAATGMLNLALTSSHQSFIWDAGGGENQGGRGFLHFV